MRKPFVKLKICCKIDGWVYLTSLITQNPDGTIGGYDSHTKVGRVWEPARL